MASKAELLVMVVIAAGLLWVEQSHRITAGTPSSLPGAAPSCPDSDSVPIDSGCMAFIETAAKPEMPVRMPRPTSGTEAARDECREGDARCGFCPSSNENAPYTEACLRFLSGWFWQMPQPLRSAPQP